VNAVHGVVKEGVMSEKEHEHESDEASEEAEETTTESEEGMERNPLSDYRTEGADT
jgi:hypothetical protein